MSHFTTVGTKINDLDALADAVGKLKWSFTRAEDGEHVIVRGYEGQTLRAVMAITIGACEYDIGVIADKVGDDVVYSLRADWWGLGRSGMSQEEIVTKLTREYAMARVTRACAAEGYEIEEDSMQVAADGTVKMTAFQWAPN